MIEIESAIIDEESFFLNYKDAKAFLRCALQFKEQNARPSLVFNTASIALERYLVALCDFYGETPRNHNYITLIKTVELFVKIPHELSQRIKAMDWIFGICSIDEYRHPNPDKTDMDNVLYLCYEVQRLFDPSRIQAIRQATEIPEIQPALLNY